MTRGRRQGFPAETSVWLPEGARGATPGSLSLKTPLYPEFSAVVVTDYVFSDDPGGEMESGEEGPEGQGSTAGRKWKRIILCESSDEEDNVTCAKVESGYGRLS